MVVPDEQQARLTIHMEMEKLVELNDKQRYTYDRDTLVKMLDETLNRTRLQGKLARSGRACAVRARNSELLRPAEEAGDAQVAPAIAKTSRFVFIGVAMHAERPLTRRDHPEPWLRSSRFRMMVPVADVEPQGTNGLTEERGVPK
jgi:hypothetical protein